MRLIQFYNLRKMLLKRNQHALEINDAVKVAEMNLAIQRINHILYL